MEIGTTPRVIVLEMRRSEAEGSGRPARPDVACASHRDRDLAGLDRFACEWIAWPARRPGDAGPVDIPLPAADALLIAFGALDQPEARDALEWLDARHPALSVLALLPPSLPPDLLRRAALLADDFVVLPVQPHELETRLLRLMPARTDRVRAAARRVARDLGLRNLVGDDPGFRSLIDGIPRVAASHATVLITGETGTGKELYARAIHHLGPRRDRPFVAVDCGAFPEQLLENELFGHVRGAFTDARAEHKGLARMAEGGVLFLDEVHTLSLAAQGKLLRFLQERTFKPLGAEQSREADVRVVAATNRDLCAEVKAQRFRADLYFRLSVLPVHIMPLRERRGDVPVLANHFLDRCNQAASGPAKQFEAGALDVLAAHTFPGNVRELSNIVQHAAVMIEGNRITCADLIALTGGVVRDGGRVEQALGAEFRKAKAHAVAEFERAFVGELLRKHGGNITQASREARKDRRAFGRLVKKYGLEHARE